MRALLNTVDDQGLTGMSLIEINDFKDYYKHMECSTFDCVWINFKGHDLTVFCDDEGMLKQGNVGRMIANYPQPIFGHIVVTGGTDRDGNTLPLPDDLSLVDLYELIGDDRYIIEGE